ncbi:MAG: hypothetical protein A3C93_00215 [Candidatus Lloydbacteria bacterium RIFCSPHIGHO2_02_FULL_54_17]|uniref:Protein kinase domain-containing protein n=1 Tax=Candidatus Lloydbacteria bacterium RIFCSPHIGHO2_02_FULL_54_17 TaxID=1798664 RepID=A0A1G2DI42_9BACT|nr:MAG: hypothetical protein A2762_03965 [Candidatus Lloydbacteria bacterium RIFCSPHIGHO2_01_FULL_54_11]OGZ13327.1 MAG: hypothetical protein A3C93_00215 [Candidatus Lloydbacteria bacterium RIFCSPHIGHO2_02_FULL_54_17]
MSALKQPRKLSLEGKGTVTIHPSDYLTSGGEGELYRIGDTVVKLYTDKEKMRRDGMIAKIALLRPLKHPSVVAPAGVVALPTGEPVGFHMPYVSGEPLSRLFTNDFRQREGFTHDMTKTLVERMREAVTFAHDKGAVLVDANELNWLARVKGADAPMPYVIDVDSWAIGKFGASVIMPSIRDWHRATFDQGSDWFAWAIVTFQLWSGIHPYKGKLDGYGPGDLLARMKANKSVFTSGVRLNRAVRDFRVIPPHLAQWYEATFESGLRERPPSAFASAVALGGAKTVLYAVTTGAGTLVFEKLFDEPLRRVVGVWPSGVLRLKDDSLVELRTKRTISTNAPPRCEVVKVEGGWLIAHVENGTLAAEYIALATLLPTKLTLPIAAQGLFRSGDRLFVVTLRGITELTLRLFSKPVLAVGGTWAVATNSTAFFDGVGVSDVLGAKFLVLPFGESACALVRAPELDSVAVVNAKGFGRFVAATVLSKTGDYKLLTFTFDREHGAYTFAGRIVDSPELNMAILPKGVAASIENDGVLSLTVPTEGRVVEVRDKHITTDMLLMRIDDQVLAVTGGALSSVRMR